MKLIILDRDGVINQDSDDYIRSVRDWDPIPGSIEAIAALSRAGFTIAIASNQSGLGRGYFSRAALEEIHAELCRAVAGQGGRIDGIFYCPHRPDEGCDCRKPATGLLCAIERQLGERLEGARFIGDSLKDLLAGEAAGCRPVLVRTGNGEATLQRLRAGESPLQHPRAVAVYRDLAQAARDILEE